MKRDILLPLLLLTTGLFLSCTAPARWAHHAVIAWEAGPADAGQRVLILTQGSDFKDAIVTKTTGSLLDQGVFVRVLDVKEAKKQSPDDWDAVLMIFTLSIGKDDAKAKAFMQAHPDADNIITVRTQGTEETYPMAENVDGISAASVMSEVNATTELVWAHLSQLLGLDEQKAEMTEPMMEPDPVENPAEIAEPEAVDELDSPEPAAEPEPAPSEE